MQDNEEYSRDQQAWSQGQEESAGKRKKTLRRMDPLSKLLKKSVSQQ